MLHISRASTFALAVLVAQYNLLRQSVAKAGSFFHADATSGGTSGDLQAPDGSGTTAAALTCTTANATTLNTSIALANDLKAKFNTHMADAASTGTSSAGAHLVPDATNGPIATADASDLTTVEALANAIKTKFNAHLTQAGVHVTNDATNAVATANATDQTTSNALLNALKTAYNAHVVSAPAGFSIALDPA